MIFKKAGAQVTSDGIDCGFIIFWFQAVRDKFQVPIKMFGFGDALYISTFGVKDQ